MTSFRYWASLSSCSATFTGTPGKRTCSSTGAPRLRVGGKSTRNSTRTPLSSLNLKRSSVGWSLASTGNPAGTPSKSPGSPRQGSSCGEVRGSRSLCVRPGLCTITLAMELHSLFFGPVSISRERDFHLNDLRAACLL